MPSTNLPLLYTQPEPLNAAAHGNLSLHPQATYGFARNTNSVPLVVDEFGAACRDYPILFTAGETTLPIAVLGLKADHNAYVDHDGQWAANIYIPAYVRRYPFIFSETPGSDELTLCIDRNPDWITQSTERPLFNDQQEPSEITQKALDFCSQFRQQLQVTREFCAALQQANLLIEQQATVTLSTGETASLSGFCVIDEPKLRELTADQLQTFHARGWLGLIYAHLISSGNWNRTLNQVVTNSPAQN